MDDWKKDRVHGCKDILEDIARLAAAACTSPWAVVGRKLFDLISNT